MPLVQFPLSVRARGYSGRRTRHGGVTLPATPARGLRAGAPLLPLQLGVCARGFSCCHSDSGCVRSSGCFHALRWGCSYCATQSCLRASPLSPDSVSHVQLEERTGTSSPIYYSLLFLGICPASWSLPPPVLPVAGLLLPVKKLLAETGKKGFWRGSLTCGCTPESSPQSQAVWHRAVGSAAG